MRHSPRLIGADASRRIAATRLELTISAPTIADARKIDAAIVADRRRSGELGEDIRSAMRSIAPVLPLVIGDHHLQLANGLGHGSPSDKISGLRPYPTG